MTDISTICAEDGFLEKDQLEDGFLEKDHLGDWSPEKDCC